MQLIPAKLPALPSGYSFFFRCALFLLIGASLLRKLFDPDVWFHMIVGREVMRRMSIPDQEFYILPRLGEPGEFHEWGFGVFYYLVEHYSGYAGMAVANAAFGCGILLFLHLAAGSKTKMEWWQSLPVMALALWAIEPRLNFRPETLLYLLLAAEIYLLENYLAQRKLAWLLPLPAFCWLLSQCHPSAIFLIGVFGMYALQAVIAAEEKIKTTAALGAVALAMAGASALNPYGPHQLLMPFYTLANDDLIKSVNEFLPVLETVFAPHFIAVAAIGAIAILLSPQKRLVDILLFLAFAVLAFRYARNIALLGIATYVPISNTFNARVERLAKTAPRKIIVALLSVAIGLAGIAKVSGSTVWGIGLDDEFTPHNNARLLKRAAVRGNLLNFYHLGSYLAWELERPVFVDGKNYGTNRAVMLHDAVFMAGQGWQSVIMAYDIQAIVTPVTLPVSGEIIPLVAALEHDRNWVAIGQERAGLLFVRSGAQGEIPLLPKETIWKQAIAELAGTILSYPESREAYRSLSAAYGHIGDAVKQREFYGKYLSLSR
ncbi:MAG: hypothetical protein HZC43_08850 [Nitrosomonadales bacterium]|nr:hypothetical protein [Nitrosomonadales bacterium]